ncbi:hypothetical protein VTI28DRAFT_4454 [Corynascus sepedonium]
MEHDDAATAETLDISQDWARYIGPVGEFGNFNPIDGNFTALVLPLCKPERVKLVAYILEYAFLHDTVVEGVESDVSTHGDEFSLGERETVTANIRNVTSGRKQIQAKMMLQLNQTDKVCAARIMDAWKTMLSTTLRDKSKNFSNLQEYIDFRIIDTGAPFVESTMLFGMGITMTPEEDALVADIIRPCYASLALANDYFSFDREWEEMQSKPDSMKPINAIWLYMQWRSVDVPTAKRCVIDAANRYERQFLELCEQFKARDAPRNPKLDLYLRALSYQVSGNVVWSLKCPRYHPEYRYDPNLGIEDEQTSKVRGANNGGEALQESENEPRSRQLSVTSSGSRDSDAHTQYSWDRDSVSSSRTSSMSGTRAGEDESEDKSTPHVSLPSAGLLGLEHLEAPFTYVQSMPSKGVRDALADALNLWAGLPETAVTRIKKVINDLHTASLMLDDIEDGSELRRGYPAAHGVFGLPQTINSACFAIVEAIQKAHELSDVVPEASEIAFEQLRDLHIGQSHDLHWARHASCPSEEEYLDMVSKKTGGLFRLLSRLMCNHLGAEYYTTQKGFYEDLDEGKLSYPLVHYLTTSFSCSSRATETLQVREILEQRREIGGLNEAHKKLVLRRLRESGSVAHTREVLHGLERAVDEQVEQLERMTGGENWVLRLSLWKLKVQ